MAREPGYTSWYLRPKPVSPRPLTRLLKPCKHKSVCVCYRHCVKYFGSIKPNFICADVFCPQAPTCRRVTPSPHTGGRWRRGRNPPGRVPRWSHRARPKLWTSCSNTPASIRASPRPSKTTRPRTTGRERGSVIETGTGRATDRGPRRPNASCHPIITWATRCCPDSTTCPTPQVRLAARHHDVQVKQSLPVTRYGSFIWRLSRASVTKCLTGNKHRTTTDVKTQSSVKKRNTSINKRPHVPWRGCTKACSATLTRKVRLPGDPDQTTWGSFWMNMGSRVHKHDYGIHPIIYRKPEMLFS